MARLPRLAVGGALHLVVQRGHNGQRVFADDADRQTFVDALHAVLHEQRVALLGYALLDDAVWLLLRPEAADGLSRAMQALGRRFVAAVNRRHGRRGTLWDGRFRATVLDEGTQLIDALVHVETKPVDAGLAPHAGDWRWSSARHHLGIERDPWIIEPPLLWTFGNTPFERETAWRRRLEAGLPAARRQAIEDATVKGWALGPPGFAAAVGAAAGRPAAPRPRGRPRRHAGGPAA